MNIHLSIVIPTYNEEANIQHLVKRLDITLRKKQITYEIIFVDDHSLDNTSEIIRLLSKLYPIRQFKKRGAKGKSFSLLEGFSYAKYPLICMIDADLQYPPEAIPEMIKKVEGTTAVVIADRDNSTISLKRKILSKTQNFLFNRILHNLPFDVQSGLKVFKKEVLERFSLHPSPWTFDLEFLIKAKQAGYTIASYPIVFSKRQAGTSKIGLLHASWEIALSAIKLKFAPQEVIPFHPSDSFKYGKGFHYKGAQYIHHSDLTIQESAFFRLTRKQQVVIAGILVTVFAGIAVDWHATIVCVLGFLTFFYFSDLLFQLFLITRNFQKQTEISIDDKKLSQKRDWPFYSIFCPLYKEANVVPQFVSAMSNLDYPKIKLEVIFLLEEDDKETIEKISTYQLPSYFKIIIVPHSFPKTKPKALNYGLSLSKGDYVVVYDAEDIPDVQQLKKVVLTFEKVSKKVACIQAKLNFYNPHQNLLTRIFTAEYSLWFDLVLTGLQSINAPIPLGGTSNHFKAKDLALMKGWDSFNVTEDCDLGIRLAKQGYQTAIINSTTLEEANSNINNWFSQRGRWIKGYIQSYFVHLRSPEKFLETTPFRQFVIFQVIVGGRVLSLFINPLMWIITISYFVFRPQVGTFIESFFPAPIFYIGILSLIFGNFLYMYYYMIGSIKRGHYSITKYAFLVPFYWLCMSISAWQALYKMIIQPHYWAKTKHGLHLPVGTNDSKLSPAENITQGEISTFPLPKTNISPAAYNL